MITATQGVDDYYRNPAATAALDISDWVFLLRQKQESIEILDELGQLSMDDARSACCSRCAPSAGSFSEVCAFAGGNGVARLILDPHSLLLFSNRLEDSTPLDAKRAAGLPIDQAINAVLRSGAHVHEAAALWCRPNVLLSAALIALRHLWLGRAPSRVAVVDVARTLPLEGVPVHRRALKPRQRRARAGALRRAAGFGTEVPQACSMTSPPSVAASC